MKHLARILSLLILVSAGLFFANCGGEEPGSKTEEETQLDKLKASTWIISTVTSPSGIVTDDFAGMKLTFSGSYVTNGVYSYTTSTPPTNGWPDANPWLDDSEWKFSTTDPTTKIIALGYTPDLEITYTVSSTTLELEFTSDGAIFTNGRAKSVEGAWSFVFEKQP
jgi:hypothetical protein